MASTVGMTLLLSSMELTLDAWTDAPHMMDSWSVNSHVRLNVIIDKANA
jgi:hypothetical protein